MNKPIIAHLVTPSNIVESIEYNDHNDDVIYVKSTYQINEETANKELLYKYKSEFDEYYYEYYLKRGNILDSYTKNKIWNTFLFEKQRSDKGIIAKIKKFIANMFDE